MAPKSKKSNKKTVTTESGPLPGIGKREDAMAIDVDGVKMESEWNKQPSTLRSLTDRTDQIRAEYEEKGVFADENTIWREATESWIKEGTLW